MTTDADRWQRVEAVCHEALARDPRDRAAFLASACGGDSGLRREVEALLAKESAAAGFLSTPLAAIAAEAIGASSNASLVGRRVGSYEMLAALGAGGMGVVYRARDIELGRDVARLVPAAGAPRATVREALQAWRDAGEPEPEFRAALERIGAADRPPGDPWA